MARCNLATVVGIAGLLVNLFTATATAADQETPKEIKPRVVKLEGLVKAIQEHKGKVVVIDLWTDGCIVCKQEFPKLVKMQATYEKEGLVAMSLNLNEPADEKTMKRVRAFLTEQKANFPHFVLDEEMEVWQKKLNITGTPVIFVFGRDGKIAKKYEYVDYPAIEKVVLELLKKQP